MTIKYVVKRSDFSPSPVQQGVNISSGECCMFYISKGSQCIRTPSTKMCLKLFAILWAYMAEFGAVGYQNADPRWVPYSVQLMNRRC